MRPIRSQRPIGATAPRGEARTTYGNRRLFVKISPHKARDRSKRRAAVVLSSLQRSRRERDGATPRAVVLSGRWRRFPFGLSRRAGRAARWPRAGSVAPAPAGALVANWSIDHRQSAPVVILRKGRKHGWTSICPSSSVPSAFRLPQKRTNAEVLKADISDDVGLVPMGDVKTARAALIGWACVSTAFFSCAQVKAADPTDAVGWRAALSLEPTDPQQPADPSLQENTSKFQITAREWISAVSKLEAHNNSMSTTQMYLYGGSLAYVPGWENGVTFLLTAYYGVSLGYSNFQDFNSTGSSNLQRLDVEALVKIPIGATPAYGALGVRFIDFKRKDNATARGYYVDGNSAIQSFTVPYTRLTDYRYFLGEVGVGTVTALDDMGKHRMFGGVMFMGGVYNTGQDYSVFWQQSCLWARPDECLQPQPCHRHGHALWLRLQPMVVAYPFCSLSRLCNG